MENETIKNASAILKDEKEKVLTVIAESIVTEKSANRKIINSTLEERMREAHRHVMTIDDLCSDFEAMYKTTGRKK